jgi:hypothetical protein
VILAISLAACGQAEPTAVPTLITTPVPTRVPLLTPSHTPDVQAAVQGTLTAIAAAPTRAPNETTPEVTPPITPSPTEVVVTLIPLLRKQIPPPLDITLPDRWKAGYDVLLVKDELGETRGIPVAAYSGPVKAGTGWIVVLWGFPNLVNPFPKAGTPVAPDLWSDGLRLLRLAVFEQGCNIGTDLKRSYRVGLEAASGTQFAAVTCPQNQPDTRGWFAGLQRNSINFVFYVYTDPINAMDSAGPELQTILDSVRFKAIALTPEATARP